MADKERDGAEHSSHLEGGNIILDPPRDDKEVAWERRQTEQHEFARSQVRTNNRIAWFTGALVLATACTIAVGIWQARISQTSANAAKGAVNVAARTLCETQFSNARQMILNDAARTANDVASQNSLNVTIMLARSDQRAWVGFGDPTFSLGSSGPIESTVRIYNFGRSPATNVFSRYAGATKPAGEILRISDIKYPLSLPGKRADTLFPSQSYPITRSSSTTVEFTPEKQTFWFNNIKSGIWITYFWGEVWYQDAFAVHHWTHFCLLVLKDLKSGSPCDIYNDTDSNPEITDKKQPERQIMPMGPPDINDPCLTK